MLTQPPGAPIRAFAYNSAVQSIASGAFTTLTLDSEDYDVGALHSTVSNTSRLTIPAGADGLYLILGTARIAAMAAGTTAGLNLRKNAASDLKALIRASVNLATDHMITDCQNLVAGDFIELQAFQDTGGGLNIGGATRNIASCLCLVKLA